MASFSDQITGFTPYQQEVPVNALIDEGQRKQMQFDEGVQRIQGEVSNIANLPIVKEQGKQYLQAKLGQLKSTLSTSVASDFSDSRLINQIGGLTREIGTDPIIQNQVQGALAYKAGLDAIEASKVKGKDGGSGYGVNNEAFFHAQANQWLNDGDLKSGFNGKYVEHIDVDSKLRKLRNDLKESEPITEIPYRRDNSGNTLYFDKKGNPSTNPANGQPVIDDAMLKVSYKGIGAQRILKTFYDSLTAEDEQQLHIDGWAHYQGATKETFANDINTKYDLQKASAIEAFKNIANDLNNPKLSSAQRAALQADVASNVKNLTEGIEKERQRDLQELNISDPETYKYKLYTQNHLYSLAQDLANESKQYEFLNNPYAEMAAKRNTLNAEYARIRMEDNHFNKRQAEDRRQFEITTGLKLRELAMKGGYAPITAPEGVRTDLPIPTLESVQKSIDDKTVQIGDLNYKYAPLIVPEYKKIVGSNLSTADKTKAIQGSLDEQFNKYLTNPNSITDNNLRSYFDRRNALELEQHTQQNLYKTINDEASARYNANIANVLKGVKGIRDRNGNVIYSPEEIVTVGNRFNKYYSTTGGGGSMYNLPVTTLNTGALLKDFKGTKFENLAIAFVKKYNGQPLTATESTMVSQFKDVNISNSVAIDNAVNDKQNFISQRLMESMPEYRMNTGTLNPEKNPLDKSQLNSLIGNSIEQYNEGKLPIENKGDFNPDDFVSWTTGKEKDAVQYVIQKNSDGSGKLIMQLGKKQMKIPIQNLGQYFPQYAVQNPFDDLKYKVVSSPFKSTNINAPKDPVNAYIQGYNLPGLQNAPEIAGNVKADVEGDPNNPDGFQIRLYVHDGNIWKQDVITNKGWVNENSAQEALNGIGVNTIKEFLAKHK